MIKDFDGHKPRIHPTAYISEHTIIIGSVTLAANVSLWPGCVLRGDVDEIIIGEDSNLQDGVLVHTDHAQPTIVGRGVTVGHGAILHGCVIGNTCLIGMGAILLDGAVVEDNCLIGAGALVTKNTRIPSGSLVMGSPGRVMRALGPDEIDRIRKSAADYIGLAALHRETSRRIV